MLRDNRELWWALTAVALIAVLYLVVVALFRDIPAASSLFGHLIGVTGFVFMLSTETLYSLRKRTRLARWGKMSSWLRIHIFTGIVGPFMVLLHSSWKLNGLAGITLMLTILIVISGFIGRYIFTAIPRTADGIEVERDALLQQLNALEQELSQSTNGLASAGILSAAGTGAAVGQTAVSDRTRQEWIRKARREGGEAARRAGEMQSLIQRRNLMLRQMNSLTAARRMLSVWHSVHIPIGMALFAAAFIHAFAAFYYATLLR